MKKTLKILTASFCFLVLMWSLSFAEKVSAAIEIDDVQINGFVTPIVGSKPYPKESFKIVSSNPHYKISSVKWMEPVDGSPHEMTTPAFREGVKYIVDIILEADTGYVFKKPSQTTTFKLNDNSSNDLKTNSNTATLMNGKTTLRSFYKMSQQPLKDVQITGFEKPVVGEKPVTVTDLKANDGACTIKDVFWYASDGNFMKTDTFEAGQSYRMALKVYPPAGDRFQYSGITDYDLYVFTKLTVNGETDFLDKKGNKDSTQVLRDGEYLLVFTDAMRPGVRVSFDAAGGQGTMPEEIVDADTYTLPPCSFTAPAGMIFDKWDLGAPGDKITLKENVTVKALWKDDGPKDSPYPAKKVSPENPIPLSRIEAAIPTRKNDKDLNCSTFSLLQAKGVPKGETSIKLSWQKVEGATGYIIYGNKCGKKNHYEKLKTTAKTSYKQKKLKKGTYYKYIVVAINGDQALAASKTIHVATNGGKYSNNTGVTLNKKKLTIKRKKSAKVKATLLRGNLQVKNHRAVAFESSDYRIATVTSKGKIKGVKKGTCYIYAYAQNGMCAKIKVKVKK